MSDLSVFSDGWLFFKGRRYRAALGRGGIQRRKREGDGVTPTGRYPIRKVFIRRDKVGTPASARTLEAIKPRDGWCDSPRHPAYNRYVRLPFRASHERLWRTDALYDICAVLGFNDSPPKPNRGSAIFMHIARDGYKATEGCVALRHPDMLQLLQRLDPTSCLRIHDRPYRRAPNIAVPTRTDVAPNAIAVS